MSARAAVRLCDRVRRALAIGACLLSPVALSATQTLTPAHDTFIHSIFADNNNGGSASIFTGRSGQGGMMRGLIRFDMPSALAGRVTVTNAVLTLRTQTFPNGSESVADTYPRPSLRPTG